MADLVFQSRLDMPTSRNTTYAYLVRQELGKDLAALKGIYEITDSESYEASGYAQTIEFILE